MPLLILAPMYNVTDTVFRQMVVACAPPDLLMTEFVNVDGWQSVGRPHLEPYLYQEKTSVPLVAQIWGLKPDNFYQTAVELAQRGFAGIDLNMGCPDKTVLKNGACSALIAPKSRTLALEIINATKEGAGKLPVSVKTRLGLNEIDLSWHQFLLEQNLAMLSVHGRTSAEKSRVPVHWDEIGQIKQMALQISPTTKIIGNGDLATRQQALAYCQKYQLDGAMLGRAVLADPFVFATHSPWEQMDAGAKVKLYRRHLELFAQTYVRRERSFAPLKKFMKVYLSNFQQAQALRTAFADIHTVEQGLQILDDYLSGHQQTGA